MAVLHSFERAGDLFAGGTLKPDVMISDRFPLADYPKAIEQFRERHRPEDPGQPLTPSGRPP